MSIKRVLQGTALTALAAAAWIGAGTGALAAEENTADAGKQSAFPVGNVDIYPGSNNMGVTVPDGAREIIVGVGKYNKNKKTVKIASWDVHDVYDYTYVSVDLSKLSNVKDNYIAVKTESTKPIYFRIAAGYKSQKAVYNAATNILSITNPKKGSENTAELKEWDIGYDSYKEDDLKETKLFEDLQYQGGTVYINSTATGGAIDATTGLPKELEEVTDAADKSASPEKYKVYDGGQMPGKQTKLNIAKQANGPSVPVNYVKGTVTIPNKTEYRLLKNDAGVYSFVEEKVTVTENGTAHEIVQTKVTASSAKTETTVADLFKDQDAASGGVLEVRKAASTNGKGKAASKWTRVDLDMPVEIALADGYGKDIKITTTGTAVIDKDKKIELSYDKDKKDKYSTKSSITVKNGLTGNIDAYVGSTKPDAKTKGVKTIKASKNVSMKVSNGSSVWIRTAGDKKTKTWAGAYTNVGTIELPADPTPTPAPTTAPSN